MKNNNIPENPIPSILTVKEWNAFYLRELTTEWRYYKKQFSVIARELKSTESTVRNQVFTAKKKLMALVDKISEFNNFKESDIMKEKGYLLDKKQKERYY